MNRLVFFTVALSIAFNVAVAQSDDDIEVESASGIMSNVQSGAEGLMNSAVDAGQELYAAGGQMTAEQQAALSEAMNEMTTYFEKSIEDMADIMDSTRSVIDGNTETVRTNLVDSLMSYVEDTDMMREQMGRVMGIRAQFQDTVLNQLSSMPISAEDAEKLESDLRERIQNQASKMSGSMQNLMSSSQMPQIPPKLASIGSNYIPKFK